MKTDEILQKRMTEVLKNAPRLALIEELYETVLVPLHTTAQIFYPQLKKLDEFEGAFPRLRINVERCYDLLELVELLELQGFAFASSMDYPENKNRDYHFYYEVPGSFKASLTLEAYFSSATCKKKQIGTTPVYEMSCNVDEAPVEIPEPPQGNEDDIPF